jgi:uncharacterized protein YecA (UPF0149 family)
MEGLSPDLYKSLRVRHKKMRAIYAHCRKRKLQALRAALRAGAVGRNDPRPCGSGKEIQKVLYGEVGDSHVRPPRSYP